MEQGQILQQLTGIFRDILENDDIVLTETTTANDIEEWDSLYHIQLVVAIEKHYKIKFTASEIQSWKNVGDMAKAVSAKLGA